MTNATVNGRVQAALPTVNLVGLAVAVALLWWRVGRLETQVEATTSALVALKVQVALVTHQPADPHAPEAH